MVAPDLCSARGRHVPVRSQARIDMIDASTIVLLLVIN